MFPVIFFVIALVLATIHIFLVKKTKDSNKVLELYLVYIMVFSIGLDGLFAASFQIFQPQLTASQIGFTNSPFLFEVAMANVGVAIAALFTIFWRGRYMLGPIITNIIFIYGAAYGHFVQQKLGNNAPYNTGIFLWAGDIIIPTIYLILAITYYFKVVRNSPN